jgi:hypothetical protein
VTVSLFSFIRNLRRNPKSSTKLGEVRTKRSGEEGQRGANPNKGKTSTGELPDELHLGGPGVGKERRRRGESAEAAGGAETLVGFLGAGGVNPSLKADLADGWEAVRAA